MQSQITTAILPLIQRGLSLLPATKTVPPALIPVYDRPLLQYAVDEARASGIRRLIVVTEAPDTGVQAYFERDEALRDALEAQGQGDTAAALDALDPTDEMEVVFAPQTQINDLGDPITSARPLLDADAPFAVILPQDLILGTQPALGEMARAYDPGLSAHMVATQIVPDRATGSYAICDSVAPAPGRQVAVAGLLEASSLDDAPSQVAMLGRYILGPGMFDALVRTEAGPGHVTRALSVCAESQGVSAFRVTGRWFDCATADGVLAAAQAVQAARPGRMQRAG